MSRLTTQDYLLWLSTSAVIVKRIAARPQIASPLLSIWKLTIRSYSSRLTISFFGADLPSRKSFKAVSIFRSYNTEKKSRGMEAH